MKWSKLPFSGKMTDSWFDFLLCSKPVKKLKNSNTCNSKFRVMVASTQTSFTKIRHTAKTETGLHFASPLLLTGLLASLSLQALQKQTFGSQCSWRLSPSGLLQAEVIIFIPTLLWTVLILRQLQSSIHSSTNVFCIELGNPHCLGKPRKGLLGWWLEKIVFALLLLDEMIY